MFKAEEVMRPSRFLGEVLAFDASILGRDQDTVAVVGETNCVGCLTETGEELVRSKDFHLVCCLFGDATRGQELVVACLQFVVKDCGLWDG